MKYRINITQKEWDSILFVEYRYSWSDALCSYYTEEDHIELEEQEAWELRDEMERDTDGGHSLFPMLDSRSELYGKLIEFYLSVI